MIGLIAAYDKNRVIGKDGHIPWNLPGEQKRFRDLTVGNVVIMGRRTYEEIGHPLPQRTTIVVSKTKTYEEENCMTAASLEEAIALADGRNIYIAGGSRLYEEALAFIDVMYITEVDAAVEGDVYFPPFDEREFHKKTDKHVAGEIPYTYVTYTRRGRVGRKNQK